MQSNASIAAVALIATATLMAPAAATADASQPAKPAAGARADGFVSAPGKKAGAGITVSYRVEGTPRAGVPTYVTLRFSGVHAADATARFDSPDGISIERVGPLALVADATTETRVAVTAATDGYYFLNVLTAQGGRTSVIAVPIKVGNVERKLAKHGEVRQTPGGEPVVVLPAR